MVALTFAFLGCGSGGSGSSGGGSSATTTPTSTSYVPQATHWPAAVPNAPTSYKNFKEIGLTPQTLPQFGDARAYGNFGSSGSFGLFITVLRYSTSMTPAEAANYPSAYYIYNDSPQGTFTQVTNPLGGANHCIHPRKALVADFNGDGKPDIFVACHGYDASPYPGEENTLLLSQPDGTYKVSNPSSEVGYFSSASAADVNGDGLPDVLVSNWENTTYPIHWLLNQGNGVFTTSYDGLPQGLAGKQFLTLELVDVNGDGLPDLFLANFEDLGQAPLVYINPGNFDFSQVSPISLPVSGLSFVTDITVGVGSGGRSIWLSKVDDAYTVTSVQRILWPNLGSTETNRTVPDGWIRWIMPDLTTQQIVSDSATQNPGLPM
ncbi:MAG: VCBS repeat-containing protein [Terracidiphilus sp.]